MVDHNFGSTVVDRANNSPKRDDPDQPNALSLASVGGCNLDACACFLGSTWEGYQGLSYELLWAF